MKNLIQTLTLTAFVTAITTNTISCTKIKYDSDIWVVTDGGLITDLSFNQYSYQGANSFVHEIKKGYNASYYEVSGSQANDFYTGYKITNIAKAKAIVLPGFRHQPYLSEASKYSKKAILVDASNSEGSTTSTEYHSNGVYSGTFNNVVGINYESEYTAFEAGLLSYFYMNKYVPIPDAIYKLSTFGGADSNSLYSYMWGLLSSEMLFDDYLSGKVNENLKTVLNNIANIFGLDESKLKPFQLVDEQQKEFDGEQPYANGTWFSDSFIPGQGRSISQTLIQNDKSNLLMPVAGGEINDALFEAQQFNSNLKIIGVDSPQAHTFNNMNIYKNLNNPIITSAEKGLDTSVKETLEDLLNNKDNNKWLGKTITAPLTPGTENWPTIEAPTTSLSKEDFNKVEIELNKLMALKCNYKDSNNLGHALIEWFFYNKGNSFQTVITKHNNFETDILQAVGK